MDCVHDYCFVKDRKEDGEWYERNNCLRCLTAVYWVLVSPILGLIVAILLSPVFYAFGLLAQWAMAGEVIFNYFVSCLAGLFASIVLSMLACVIFSVGVGLWHLWLCVADCYDDYRRRRYYAEIPDTASLSGVGTRWDDAML